MNLAEANKIWFWMLVAHTYESNKYYIYRFAGKKKQTKYELQTNWKSKMYQTTKPHVVLLPQAALLQPLVYIPYKFPSNYAITVAHTSNRRLHSRRTSNDDDADDDKKIKKLRDYRILMGNWTNVFECKNHFFVVLCWCCMLCCWFLFFLVRSFVHS